MSDGGFEMRDRVNPLMRGEVRVTDTISSTPTPTPVSASSQSQSAFEVQPRQTSALVFQPGSDVDHSSTTKPPRSVEPLHVPFPSLIRPQLDTHNSTRTDSSGTDSTGSASGSGSGSGSTSRHTLGNNHQNNSSRPRSNNSSNSRPNTPILTGSESDNLMRPTSRKGKEVMEITTVPFKEGSLGLKQGTGLGEEQTKEDLALAKWRKWVVEQPLQIVPTQSISPIRSRRGTPPAQNIPMVPLGPAASPKNPLSSPYDTFSPKHRSSSFAGPSSSTLFTSPRDVQIRSSRFGSADMDICNTESVMALRDVELAVDPEIIERGQRAKEMPRRMSTQPRISELPNPFVDIASRLGSRRVRPIVLELIQALGHYVDAVWCVNYPSRPCPWIIGVDESPLAPSTRRMNMTYSIEVSESMGWKSPMITAVQEGKKSGHVPSDPTLRDVKFWEAEVKFAIRDVDEVVGIYKGVGWAFACAMEKGDYGSVSDDNVLGVKGEGAGLARLLNDLEEAIWGDAPPRSTDLAYDLPIDFDPYAILDDSELMAAAAAGPRGRGSALSDFFSDSVIPKNGRTSTVLEEDMNNLPDLMDASASDGAHTDGMASPDPSHLGKQRSGSYIPGMEEIEGAEEMTLEELGKKRHREWLESRRADGIAGGW
ncbi:hypothetical protein IAR55_005897 [Kwoniella newhampshirensis]|uniref:Uncharacterized protein n=1 Tax=Kwoniella newhampshirensis TaxID=1651941 RepID=A0AAW0YK17_9TREE